MKICKTVLQLALNDRMLIDSSISPSVLTALLVGSIAAMTLTVSGLKNMYDLANNALKSQKIKVENDRKYALEFGVLENTYVITVCFGVSEVAALAYIGLKSLLIIDCDYLLIIGLVALFVGLIITIYFYSYLRIKGLAKNKIDVSDYSLLYSNS